MAYDRDEMRDESGRWSNDRHPARDRDWRGEHGGRTDRGFFERAGDEIASWFGDDDAEHGRREHHRREEPSYGARPSDNGRPEWRGDRFRDRGRDYRPMAGDYGRVERERSAEWDRDPYRSTSRAGTADLSDRSRHEDPHYRSLRDRHLSELDRDYDDYRREHQSKFENDFGSWRDRRQQKRIILGQVREHMDVVGNDDEHIGTVDKVASDRLILTKSDPESGGVHYSLSCSDLDRIEGNRVILDCSADQARKSWRDESRSRALFEREDQGEIGPRVLDRSFGGTYR